MDKKVPFNNQNFILEELTIGDAFARRVEKTPDAVAVEFENEKVTWAELDLLSDWLVKRFDFLGIRQGSRCALWCGNHLQWIIVYIGLQKIGATAILVNPGYLASELYKVLAYAQIEYLFYGETFKDRDLNAILEELDLLEHPYLKQTIPIELEDAISFMVEGAKRLTEADYERIRQLKAIPKPKDVACMLFTSGTTAEPKGVLLTHYNLINCAKATTAAMHWDETDKTCVMVPLFHCFGMTSCLLGAIVAGNTLYVMKYYRTADALDAIQNHGCTVLNGVPSMFLAMIYNHDFDKYDLSRLKNGIIAGSSISVGEYKKICEKLKISHLQMSYGQTETSPGVSFSRYEETVEEKGDNAGFIVPYLDAGILDSEGTIHVCVENGTPIQINESPVGEILIRGFLVMKEYYKRPEATAGVLDADGWLKTGDRGFFDEQGHLHVLGRMKDIIIRGGENISPGEIEECILELPEVKQVKVVGVPHPILQEEIAAVIVLKSGCSVKSEDIRSYVASKLAPYKVPEYYAFYDAIPMTTSGKIAIGELKKEMASLYGYSQIK